MSAAFEAFGIKKVSPSELKVFNHDHGLWFAKHGKRLREGAGPAAWRGESVEAGVNVVLHKRANAFMIAAQTFEQRSSEWSTKNGGEVHPDHDEEAGKVSLCLERAIAAIEAEPLIRDAGVPSSSQGKCEVHLPGAPIPIGGYWDWGFGKMGEGFTLDLKTGNSIPSDPPEGESVEIDPDHGLQFSVYARARGEQTASGLYVSAKPASSGFRTEEKPGKDGAMETRWYHKSSRKRLKFNPETPEGVAELKALDDTANADKKTHILVSLTEADIERYCDWAVQTMLTLDAVLTAALAMVEYECTTKEAALARLCRPNLMAKGGGFYPIWKPEFLRTAAEAVPEWGLL